MAFTFFPKAVRHKKNLIIRFQVRGRTKKTVAVGNRPTNIFFRRNKKMKETVEFALEYDKQGKLMTMFERYQKGLLPQTIYSRVGFAESPEEKLFVAGYFTAKAISKGEIQTADEEK